MKFKIRSIAAIAMATISSVCTMQSLSINTSAVGNFSYTSVSQTTCESSSYMNSRIAAWKTSGKYKQNSTWNRTVTCGTVVGAGFGDNLSGKSKGDTLYGDLALVRSMAQDYFGTTVFQELEPSYYFSYQIGDQLYLKNGNAFRRAFVYELPSDSNGQKLKTVELVNGKIAYDREYFVNVGTLTYAVGNQTLDILSCTRPIKQGDANGDGYVYGTQYINFGSDFDVIKDYVRNGVPSGETWKRNLIKTASDIHVNNTLNSLDYTYLYYDQHPNGYFLNNGRMEKDWYYYIKEN